MLEEVKSKKLADLTLLVTYYNKGEFLPDLTRNLEAILGLGARIILVDDGSDLNHRDALEKYLLKASLILSNQFEFISQKNKGSAASRNLLISRTQTPYFMFLDADDLVIVNNLDLGLRLLKEKKVDILIGDYVDQNGRIKYQKSRLHQDLNGVIQLNGNFEVMQGMGFWRIIYRREFIDENRIKFVPTKLELRGEHFIFDDVFWMIQICCSSGRGVVMQDGFPIYRYFTVEFTSQSRELYRKQEMLMPLATKYYMRHRRQTGKLTRAERLMLLDNLFWNFLDLTPYSMKKTLSDFSCATLRAGGLLNLSKSLAQLWEMSFAMWRKWYESKSGA